MRTNLVKVGNSKGIIIPAALLASCGLKDAVEMQIKGKKLVIEALQNPRDGWFEGYKPEQDPAAIETIPEAEDTADWVW